MVIGLAPSHPVVQQKKLVKEIKFQSEHRDFTKNVVRGAKKRVRVDLHSVTSVDVFPSLLRANSLLVGVLYLFRGVRD